MSKLIYTLSVSLVLTVLMAASAIAKPTRESTGFWLTEDKRFVISVRHCNATLCGSIYWIAGTAIPLDVKNPDPHKRANPLCGMEVMAGFKQRDANNWVDGTIYRPSTGKSYNSTIQILPSGEAFVHGYLILPIFGHTQILTPVSQKEYPRCKR